MSSHHQRPIISFYEVPHYYLSNFSAFGITIKREFWMTVEHAYQARKFHRGHETSVVGAILRAPSAHEAKQIAKANRSRMRADWEQIKLGVMEELLRVKFAQHSYVRQMLLKTNDLWLVEDSPTDAFWGRGPGGGGLNHLGKLWMKIRTEEQARLQKKSELLANG